MHERTIVEQLRRHAVDHMRTHTKTAHRNCEQISESKWVDINQQEVKRFQDERM